MYLAIEEKSGRIECPKCGGKASLKSMYSDMLGHNNKYAFSLRSYCWRHLKRKK